MPIEVTRDPEELLRQLGLAISRIRVDLGLSQPELAARAGIDADEIRRIESGELELGICALLRLALALRIGLVTLLEAATTVEWSTHGQRAAIIVDGLPPDKHEEALARLRDLLG